MNLAARPEVLDADGAAGQSTASCEAILTRLMQLHPKLIDLSLGRLRRLLERLGHPERQLPPVFHVAGTNGKGSTIAFVRAALEAAGKRVHVMTSPHLVRFNERIRLAGKLISDEELIAVLSACEAANGDDPITYFEVTTAAAFLAFRDSPADILLLETGLGGRLDASNVVERPLLTAISAISMDHQHFLGDTLAEIAGEKAGILKPGVTGIIGQQEAEALGVIEAAAERVGAPLLREGHEWHIRNQGDHLLFQSSHGDLRLPMPNLLGPHQVHNAGLAVACLQNLEGFNLSRQDIAAGVTQAQWPGRLQRLQNGPLRAQLVEELGPNSELWLDGGHNPGAGAALAQTLRGWQDQETDALRLYLIVGMLKTKDAGNFLAPFQGLAEKLYAVPVPYEDAAMTPAQIAQAASAQGLHATPTDSIADALHRIAAAQTNRRPVRVLICGTLYLAGSVLATNPQPDSDLG